MSIDELMLHFDPRAKKKMAAFLRNTSRVMQGESKFRCPSIHANAFSVPGL